MTESIKLGDQRFIIRVMEQQPVELYKHEWETVFYGKVANDIYTLRFGDDPHYYSLLEYIDNFDPDLTPGSTTEDKRVCEICNGSGNVSVNSIKACNPCRDKGFITFKVTLPDISQYWCGLSLDFFNEKVRLPLPEKKSHQDVVNSGNAALLHHWVHGVVKQPNPYIIAIPI